MVENQTINWSAIVIALLALGIQAPDYIPEPEVPKFFCESRPILGYVECDEFAKYVSEVGKCIRYDDSNIICRDGWKLVTPDLELDEELHEEENSDFNYIPDKGDMTCYAKPQVCVIMQKGENNE